jgi:hypothetical protein
MLGELNSPRQIMQFNTPPASPNINVCEHDWRADLVPVAIAALAATVGPAPQLTQ